MGFEIKTVWERLVAEYSGLSLIEVEELDYIDYLTLRRDAFIHKLEQSERGQEYLNTAWRLEQTKPDREKLRKKLGKGAEGRTGKE